MEFWVWILGIVVASALVFIGLSLNGKTEGAAGGHDAHGHDNHGHGHASHH